MAEAALALEGIRKVYNPGAPDEVVVLAGADLTLATGEAVALAAPSGAGKSTLLHIAGLLDTPDSGQVRVEGADAGALTDARRTALRRRRIGFVYQFHHLLPEFTAAENIILPQLANGAGRAPASDRAAALLEAMGVGARARHRPAALSGGERQRVAIARALANRPRLLLADEPTGNLDPATAGRVFDALMTLVADEGLTLLVATHNLELARRMDRRLTLKAGRLVPTETP